MTQRTASPGLGSLGSGAVTAASLGVQTGLAAVVGVIIAREFGRSAETDGFFAAYGVFAVAVLAAQAIRITVLPPLTRARAGGRLTGETASYALSLACLAAPILVASIVAAGPIARLLTADGPTSAQDAAAAALPWMMVAAGAQLFAGLGASALAALDDYVVAASGYIVGSVSGLVFILLRVDDDGIQAVSWGMALNGVVAATVPALALALRGRALRVPRSAARPHGPGLVRRLTELGQGVSLPLALQAVYLVCLPFAAREGVGAVTSFGYAYLLAAALVATTASSLGIVTAVPLTRGGLDRPATARHIVASSWIALTVIGGAAGVFATAGEPILSAVLGQAYERDVGSELGRLVVWFAPWAVAAVGVSVTFPLVFVARRVRRLPLLAVAVLVVHLPLAWGLQVLAGLDGLALALALTTGLALAVMLVGLEALGPATRGLGTAAVLVAVIAVGAFGAVAVVTGPAASGALGIAVYGALLAVLRPSGLRRSWHYLRALR